MKQGLKRFCWQFLIGVIVLLLALAAVMFFAFSEFEATDEPVINGLRVRRYVASHGSATDMTLPGIGPDAIPWIIKGVEAEDSAFYKLKVRVWKLLPKQLQFKWRYREPINPRTLRVNCARALGLFGPEAVAGVPSLIQFAQSNSNLQTVAFVALTHIAPHSSQARDFLVASLRDGSDAVKRDVVTAFMVTGRTPAEAVPLLVARLENYVPPDPRAPLLHNEMSALSVCGPEAAQAVPVLIQYMMREGRGYGIRALRATGPAALPALPRLLEMLEKHDEWAVQWRPDIYAILAGLGTNGTAALPALTNGLADKSPVVGALAAAGIANITGDVEFAIPRLIEQLENRERSDVYLTVQVSGRLFGLSHRELAARLLGEIGGKATNALPSLRQAVNGSERWMHIPAAEAIWKISKETNSVLPALVARLQTTSNDDTRMLALKALGQMGPAARPAVPAIHATMASNLNVRQYGYVALQQIERQ